MLVFGSFIILFFGFAFLSPHKRGGMCQVLSKLNFQAKQTRPKRESKIIAVCFTVWHCNLFRSYRQKKRVITNEIVLFGRDRQCFLWVFFYFGYKFQTNIRREPFLPSHPVLYAFEGGRCCAIEECARWKDSKDCDFSPQDPSLLRQWAQAVWRQIFRFCFRTIRSTFFGLCGIAFEWTYVRRSFVFFPLCFLHHIHIMVTCLQHLVY